MIGPQFYVVQGEQWQQLQADLAAIKGMLCNLGSPKYSPAQSELTPLRKAAPLLGMSAKTLQRRLDAGRYPHYRSGRLVVVDVEEIRALMRGERR